MGFMFCDLHVSLKKPFVVGYKFVEFALLYMLFVFLLSYFYALLLLLTDSKTVDTMKHLLASVESVLTRGGHQFVRRLLGNTCLCRYESF